MKGFLGTFIIFLLWTSICFYYLNIGEISSSISNASNVVTNNDVPNTSTTEQNLTPDSYTNINATTSYTQIDSTESKRIANEIEKSISTSDTTQLDKEIPVIENKEETTTTSNILRPSYNDSGLILDDALINFATELKKLLEEHSEKTVTIIGHTDSIGSNEENLTDGLKKARQVRWYLTAKRNILDSRITAISKGEENPIEDNTTSKGRELNNRIEIIVN